MIKKQLMVAVLVAAFGGLATSAAAAAGIQTGALSSVRPLAGLAPAAPLRTCSPGYVHASLSWGEKCLRVGEFCKVGNTEYHRYGFTCPAGGHLVYYRGKRAAPSKRARKQGGPPPGVTALCRDGTYSYSQHHSGTCSHHGGVAVWYR